VECLLRHQTRPVWIDEAPRTGGQIYRRPPPALERPGHTLYGFEAGRAKRLHAAADAAAKAADYRPESLVWDIQDGAVEVAGPAGAETIAYDALILATGAMDRILPLLGWTLPGVFTLGGAQIALKAQACAIGRRCILLGTGPLLYLLAYQYAKAGAGLAGVLDTTPAEARLRALPRLMAAPGTLAKGVHYVTWLKARGITLHEGIRPLEITGDGRVEGLRFRERGGRERHLAGDAVAIGFGLKPEFQLAELAGCQFDFDAPSALWLPRRDAEGRAEGVPALYLAGDAAAITGADAAELAGEQSALALLADRGVAVDVHRCRKIARRLARIAGFRAGIEASFPYPLDIAPSLAANTIICRCEGVSAGQLRATVQAGARELNRAKAICRLGMGRCQGRLCGGPAAEILASELGVDLPAVDRLRAQPPLNPHAHDQL
jgi:thioredoxin reductase